MKDDIFGGSKLPLSCALCNVVNTAMPCLCAVQCAATLSLLAFLCCFPACSDLVITCFSCEFYRSDPIWLSVAPTVRIGFISCSPGWACILSRRSFLVVPLDICAFQMLFHSVVSCVATMVLTVVFAFRRSLAAHA